MDPCSTLNVQTCLVPVSLFQEALNGSTPVFLRVLQLEEEVRGWDVVRKRLGVAHAQVLTSDSLRIP